MTDSNQPGLFDASSSGDGDAAITLARYAEQAYLDYAVSVVRGRALPDVGDGQKPVQRRILFAMQAMGLAAGAKPVKSARVVGDVLGKYHPHGDQAAYDAMVRMAQDFSLRYPLIDGQGNFGSRDGDNAAAMRYTEARLTPIAKLLLDELDEGTVDFVPNYDGSQEEPQMLPARLPVMLLNGASGIAVGMATEIPPHNLREVAQACVTLIKQPQLTDAELYSLVPGPDFAGGGQIITPAADIAQIYSTGRGSLKVRARWQFEEMARGQWQLVVTELPPGTSCQKVLEEIEEITNPKVKTGKKSLTPEQTQSKAVMLNLLDAVRDESGKDAAVRLVFEPKTSRVDRDEFVNTLLAQTSMESSASVNLVCIGTDGRPRQKGLRDILTEWLAFRTQTVTRRTRFRLDKVIDRIHVLEGRMVVYLNVDEVIQTIRESDEPRAALMERFADRAPGRRHPGNAPAPAGPPGRDQDRAGTGRQARRAGSPAGAAGQPGLAQAPAGQGNRGRRQAIWRRSPHADRDGRARRAGNQGAGRAGDRDRVAEGLAARAQATATMPRNSASSRATTCMAPSNAAPPTR